MMSNNENAEWVADPSFTGLIWLSAITQCQDTTSRRGLLRLVEAWYTVWYQ